MDTGPSYLVLNSSGILKERMHELNARLANCTLCPRACAADRLHSAQGFCQSGSSPAIDSICAHHGEEPLLSGTQGSGTVFFSNCNLRCVFCQNFQISQGANSARARIRDHKEAARQIIHLQDEVGVHNINFVSPSHMVPQMVSIIYEAVQLGLHLPIVYNSNGYDSVETLQMLDGIVDIYLPDFKYFEDSNARKYSQAKNYPDIACEAITEMFRQVGPLQLNEKGLASRGLLVRHLILPNDLSDSEQVLAWLGKQFGSQIAISLMSQYFPTHKAFRVPLLARGISYAEFRRASNALQKAGLERGYVQDMSAPEYYQPDFEREDHPFESVQNPI